MQTEQLLCWSDMTDTEHSTTSGSNEIVVAKYEECFGYLTFNFRFACFAKSLSAVLFNAGYNEQVFSLKF